MKVNVKANLFMILVIMFSVFIPGVAGRALANLLGMYNYVAIAEYILFLLPALIYILISKESPKKVFSLNKISFVDILLSILVAFLARPLAGFLSGLTGLFFENPVEEAFEVLESMSFPTMLFAMAITPAICEEVVTRGIFLHGCKKTSTLVACLANGVVFCILHMDMQQSLYTFALGFIFAYMVRATNSIWSSVLCHFTFNSISVVTQQLLKLLSEEQLQEMMESAANSGNDVISVIASFIFAIPFTVGLVFVLLYMYKRNHKVKNPLNVNNLPVEKTDNNYFGFELTVKEGKGLAYLSFGLLISVYALIMISTSG